MNIRRFDKWDDMINEYNNNINATNQQMTDLNNQKQAILNQYGANYNQQLSEYNNLMNQGQDLINQYKQTQENALQKQLEENQTTINKNKEEAQEQIAKEKQDAYTSYMKNANKYGGVQEQMATQGLANTGYNASAEIAIYSTYQNRVSAANTALTKANAEYDRQIQEAKTNNDVALAEVALNTLQKSYELALQGFEYKNTLFNNKTNFEMQVEDNYFNKGNTLQNRIDNYREAIASINQYREKMAEEKRQFNQSLAASKSSGGGTGTYDDNLKYTVTEKRNDSQGGDIGITPESLLNSGSTSKETSSSGSTNKAIDINTSKMSNLNLSSNEANKFYNNLKSFYSKKYTLKLSDLELVLDDALDNDTIDENDYLKIANAFGVSATR